MSYMHRCPEGVHQATHTLTGDRLNGGSAQRFRDGTLTNTVGNF